ncbi:MFS general substrate transporter [Mycena venus]|uniref:MFS general substrate transporter n=1 Tax=Mycena venus TaxID=2733690 RepID=A0A8H6WYG2_9AGAR|nr:MFS general substrate transporter [Mycena venus]
MSSGESWAQEEETFEADPFVAVFPSRSRSVTHRERVSINVSGESVSGDTAGEREPLLGNPVPISRKKPFYRARPLWLVPFAIAAALIRGMTLSPRVETYTQLACSRLYHKYNHPANTSLEAPFYYRPSQPASVIFFNSPPDEEGSGEDRSGQLPSRQCKSDPAVTAGAARIQTIFTITMGLLSALTTGWWGHFGEKFGRTKVLAISTFGWFLTDLTFILVSHPSSPIPASYAHKLVLMAPVFEGALGGWSTLQSGTSAYISDCTSSGSRASVFSRFTGVSFLGFSLGPIIGGWLIRHPIALFTGQSGGQSVTSVFCVAAIASFVNFCFMLFVMPESVSKEQRDRASGRTIAFAGDAPSQDPGSMAKRGIFREFFSPLAIFLPVSISIEGRKRRDWSLTLLTCALFGYMLSAGLYQIKYLYGSHIYSWDAEQLSYYISFMGGGRALFLLFVLPLVISKFKPKLNLPKIPSVPGVKAAKPKPTKAHLAREIRFDLRLARISLCIDIIANTAIMLMPAPSVQEHAQLAINSTDSQFQRSQALFVLSSWIATWGAGLIPAIHSLALCIIQARALLEAGSGEDVAPVVLDASTGKLFGALAVLQAIGQMILGPALFGLIYYGTVATFPKAVFATAMGILFVALLATLLVRNPLADVKGKSPVRRRLGQRDAEEEEERGRSRTSKDLRGSYGSFSEAGSPPEQGPSTSGSN